MIIIVIILFVMIIVTIQDGISTLLKKLDNHVLGARHMLLYG